MPLIDTHCHLQDDAFNEDRDVVLAAALSELDALIVIGDALVPSEAAIELVSPRIFAAAGVHPHNATEWDSNTQAMLYALLKRPGVVGLGEIGLDYYYDFSPRPLQCEVLEKQLAMAVEIGLPVVIHCREAQEDLIRIIEPFLPKLAGGVMHCFGGDAAFAQTCLQWGFYISFAGNVTYPKAQSLREAAKIVPLDRLLVETDSPYLAPVPNRGRRCEPTFVRHTAEYLAQLKEVPFETLATHTTENARRLFKL